MEIVGLQSLKQIKANCYVPFYKMLIFSCRSKSWNIGVK